MYLNPSCIVFAETLEPGHRLLLESMKLSSGNSIMKTTSEIEI